MLNSNTTVAQGWSNTKDGLFAFVFFGVPLTVTLVWVAVAVYWGRTAAAKGKDPSQVDPA